MEHIQTTPRPPELETGDDTLRTEILAIFRISAVPGWVYVAMTGDQESDLHNDIQILIVNCPVVVREDTTITLWNDDRIVLSIGTGHPTFYKILGEEFVQTLRCLACPPSTFYTKPDSFSLDEWVSIGRPGTYWGDVGLVHSLSDEEDEECITILLVPRITDDENMVGYLQGHVRPPLQKDVWPHSSDDPSSGRPRITKDGLLMRSFAPWELRKDTVEGGKLYLLPMQEAHFRRVLPPEDWPRMPPVFDPRGHFMRGERVRVAGHNGIIAGFDKSVAPEHDAFPLPRCTLFYAELERVYSETWKEHVYCHPSFIIKQHKEKDTVFSLALKENVVVVESNYLKEVVIIQLRSTAARRYRKEELVR
jgi:hypothetical protein